MRRRIGAESSHLAMANAKDETCAHPNMRYPDPDDGQSYCPDCGHYDDGREPLFKGTDYGRPV